MNCYVTEKIEYRFSGGKRWLNGFRKAPSDAALRECIIVPGHKADVTVSEYVAQPARSHDSPHQPIACKSPIKSANISCVGHSSGCSACDTAEHRLLQNTAGTPQPNVQGRVLPYKMVEQNAHALENHL